MRFSAFYGQVAELGPTPCPWSIFNIVMVKRLKKKTFYFYCPVCMSVYPSDVGGAPSVNIKPQLS